MVCTLNTDNGSSKIHPKIKIRIRIYKNEKKKEFTGKEDKREYNHIPCIFNIRMTKNNTR